MVYFLPLFIVLIAPLVLTVFYRRWPRLALLWLGLIGITLVSWTILLLARLQLPIVFDALSWGLTDIFPSSPALVIDQSSWPYAMGLITLLLAILITDVVRTYIIEFDDAPNLQVSWNSWVICTLAAGFALLAVLAKNPLTLVIGWTVLSIMELSHRLIERKSDQDTQFSVLIFVARIIGVFFIIIAMISMSSQGLALDYSSLTPVASFWLFLAAAIYLGILPFSMPSGRLRQFPLNLEISYVYFPAAAALTLLSRLASSMIYPSLPTALVLLCLLAGLLASLKWITTENNLHGQTAWVGGMASLATVAAIVMQPAASQAWGLALLLFGGLIALYTAYHQVLRIILGITLIGLTALPLTQTWAGILVFHPSTGTPLIQPIVILMIILALAIQSLLLGGSVRLVLTSQPKSYPLERWIWLIYGWGLLILALVNLLLAWWGGLWAAVTQASLSIVESLIPGMIVVLICGLALFLYWRGMRFPQWIKPSITRISDPGWFLKFSQAIFGFIARISTNIDLVLEGSGGILWTLLLITLLASIITQVFMQVSP